MRTLAERLGRALGLLAAGGLLIGAGAAGAANPPLVGMWGGEQAILTLDAQGGRLELGTGHALLSGAIRPDAKGRFIAKGLYFAEPPGPTLADKPPQQAPARFEGVVARDELVLKMKARGVEPQAFTLKANRRIKLIRAY
jgi:hypothetical protein